MGDQIDYKSTIALPKTDFPMKANLAEREPVMLERWKRDDLYHRIVERNRERPPFVLHDGPPYANGHIHHGHILNKVLKDIVVKVHNMSGHCSEFIPGWDCHGLPIEHQVDKELGPKKKDMSVLEVRAACSTYAQRFVDVQRAEFERLGVLADWDHPYLTLQKPYEAQIVRELARFVGQGLYKGTKPVHWCWSCRTALAEAEVEYGSHRSPSIYVRFDVVEGAQAVATGGKPVQVLIWTTTPWTLPANRAIAYGPHMLYKAYPHDGAYLIVAVDLREAVARECGVELDDTKALPVPTEVLRQMVCAHPFLDAVRSPLLPADYVRAESGTGLVHTAPGHGPDDFNLGSRHGLPIVSPVDAGGRFTDEAGVQPGVHVFDANAPILDLLVEKGRLLSPRNLTVEHDYAHCWRCKKPVIFRATAQWFVSMSEHNLRARALEAVDDVTWIPSWGRERIHGMLSARPDWCLSRQRSWGVPIPAFYCESCDTAILERELCERVADLFADEGADAWYAREASALLPPGYVCPSCGGNAFRKESDIVDVWFESGVSYAAVCEQRAGYSLPVDLYLEGSDQHRGWFHSSLLAAVGTRGAPPYKTVLTHGFVVDGQGRKYSKSSPNYSSPDKVIKKYGAEVFRLWVCATDFGGDLHFSDEILTRLVEAYRKVRNTVRFMLGNLSDFDPRAHAVADGDLREVDRYMLARFGRLVEQVRRAYESYDFHVVYQRVVEFAIVDLSAFYFDLLKDWLYCDPVDAVRRRSAQTALYRICKDFLALVAPVLSFTAEEAHDHLANDGTRQSSVHLEALPEAAPYLAFDQDGSRDRFDRLRQFRDHVLGLLEPFRAQKHHPLEARVLVRGSFEVRDFLQSFEDLPAFFGVSQIEMIDGQAHEGFSDAPQLGDFGAMVITAQGQKCARCWTWSPDVGKGRHPDVCPRCDAALG
ncbi:MAG: isoleucine--tRNA ligase [Pseudomonadota bacterium]